MLEEVEERLLHHVRYLVALEGRPHQNDGAHGRNHVVGRRGLLLLEEGLALLLGGRRGEGRGSGASVQAVALLACATHPH